MSGGVDPTATAPTGGQDRITDSAASMREGFDPFDPATWTAEERTCYALGYGHADNGLNQLIEDEAPEPPA